MHRRWKKVLVVGAVVAVAAVGVPSPASAITGVTVTPPSGPAGTNVVVTGTCVLGDTARIIVSTPASQTASDSTLVAGAFSIPFTVPASTPPGAYVIAVDCGIAPLNIFIPLEATVTSFTVTGSAAPTSPTDASFSPDLTGFDVGPAVPVNGVPRFTG